MPGMAQSQRNRNAATVPGPAEFSGPAGLETHKTRAASMTMGKRERLDQEGEMLTYTQVIPIEGRVSEHDDFYGRHRAGHQLSFNFAEQARTANAFRDPAFSENKTQPLHRWVPWIAGFSAQFVQDCFETFLKDRRKKSIPCALDPFAGVGTTLVQALLNGVNCIGFEINPYAALACNVKVNSPKLDLGTLEACCLEYQKIAGMDRQPAVIRRPAEFQTRIPFFSPPLKSRCSPFSTLLSVFRIPRSLISSAWPLALSW